MHTTIQAGSLRGGGGEAREFQCQWEFSWHNEKYPWTVAMDPRATSRI